MKQIRTIKYIDMFVPTNDFKEDHLIDITREPYYKKVTDVTQNTFNICEIIYKKSLDYGFPISKAIDFSKNAGLAHLENNPNADNIIKDVIDRLSNNSKILSSSSSESIRCIKSPKRKFKIVEETNEKIIIHDHCETGIEILKHLVGIESKMIIYELNVVKSYISISFLDFKGTEFKITDFNLSKKNIKFIREKIKVKNEIVTIMEVSNNIKVFFLGKMIYDTKEGKIIDNDFDMRNLSSSESESENVEKEIKPYEEIILENNSEDTEESEGEEQYEDQDLGVFEYNNKIIDSIKSEKKNIILINPILLIKKNNLKEKNIK